MPSIVLEARSFAISGILLCGLLQPVIAGYHPSEPACTTYVSTVVQYYTTTITETGTITVYANATKSAHYGYYAPRGSYPYPKSNSSSSTPPPYTPPPYTPPLPGTNCPIITTTTSSTVTLTSSLLVTESKLIPEEPTSTPSAFPTEPQPQPPPLKATDNLFPSSNTALPSKLTTAEQLIETTPASTLLATPLKTADNSELSSISAAPTFNPGPSEPPEQPPAPSAPESQVGSISSETPPPPEVSEAPVVPTTTLAVEPSATESAPPESFTGGAAGVVSLYGGSWIAGLIGLVAAWM